MFLITVATGEISQLGDIYKIEDIAYRNEFLMMMLASGIMGIVITMSMLLTVTLCSPIAVNITGNRFYF